MASTDRLDGVDGPALVVGILGRVRATVGGQELDLGGPRQRALLAALAVEAGRTVPTSALIEAVWDGDPPEAAERTFRSYVSRLRKALSRAGRDGAEVVVTDAAGYRLDAQVVVVDAALFEAEVAAARDRLADGEAAVAAELLAAALGRWEGRALGEFSDRVWAAPSSVRLEEQRLIALELQVRALLDAGRTADAVTEVEQLAVAEPLRESVARLHALALYRAGRDADALRVAREFRDQLAEEHGLDPSPQLGELESMVLDRDPRLDRSVGGRRLRGYVLHEPIARSPLGTVHRAEQPSIGREVAITVIPAERADAPDVVRAFEARVQAVAGLEHAHLLPVYDYWREPGAAYIVTRFPAGGTLTQLLRTGAPAVEELLRVGEQVAGALAAAHEAGVVHGDIGPDAVVIDERGDAFVWGFSLDLAAHARTDVAALAALVRSSAPDASDGALRTSLLPEPAAAAVDRALDPTDVTLVTAAALAAAFAAARTGADVPIVAPVEVGPNPYRGLAAFRETDAAVFFGRDELVGKLQARVARTRAVAVVGPSGSGKSSAVRAGLLPRLRAEGAFVTTMVPGTRPLAELEVALSRVAAVELRGVADEIAATTEGLRRVVQRALPTADGDLVLVVDQFEELFTLSEPTERDLLLAALRAAVEDPNGRIRVVVTVRADFLGRVLAHPTAGPLVRDRSVMVTPLTDDELHEVVVGPAEVAGVAVEPALATAIVADAARFPGSLPMVQFALTEVFAAAEDGTMELAAYRRIGGIEGVLGQRAEEVYTGLDESGQRAAHALFDRLVVPNADGPPTRRRARRSEFSHVPDTVIEAFGRARLLRFDNDQQSREPIVEVTHEAVFRAWPRLVAWIEEGEDQLRTLGHLTIAAGEWDEGGKLGGDLYRGNRLDAALEFAAPRREELTATERAFLDASIARRHRDAASDRRTVRRLRALTGGLAVGLVLALIAGTLALVFQGREAATAEEAQADAIAAAARSTLGQDNELATLLALEAYAASPDAESMQAILAVVGHEPRVRQILEPPPTARCGDRPPGADLAVYTLTEQSGAGGDEIATYAQVVTFAGEQQARIQIEDDAICASVDPTGRWVISGSDSGTLILHDAASGRGVAQRDNIVVRGFTGFVEFDPLHPRAVVQTTDGVVQVVDLPTLRTTALVGDTEDLPPLFLGVFGERGGVLGGATADRRLWRAQPEGGAVALSDPTGEELLGALVAEQADRLLGITPGGLVVTSLRDPGVLTAVNLRGEPSGPGAVSATGELLAIPTTAGIEVVDLATMRPVGTPVDVDTTIPEVSWGPDGEVFQHGPSGLVTVDIDRSIAVGRVVDELTPTSFRLWPAADASGAIQGADPESKWIDLDTGEEHVVGVQTEADAYQELHAVAPLPDRQWARLDLGARVFERGDRDGPLVSVPLPDDLPPHLVRVWGLLRVDHGMAVVVVDEDALPLPQRGETLGTWVFAFDLQSGALVARLRFDLDERVAQARALPGGLLVLATYNTTALVVDLEGQEVVAPAMLDVAGEHMAVSASGELIALAGFADDVVIVDDQLQEVVRLTGVASRATTLRFAGEGRLVTGHLDGTTNVWDVAAGRLLGRLLHAPGPYGFEPTADGTAIHHSTPSGIVRIPLDPASWVAAACSLVSRPLTAAELDAVVVGRTPLDPCGFSTT